jgi:hypothetical protein
VQRYGVLVVISLVRPATRPSTVQGDGPGYHDCKGSMAPADGSAHERVRGMGGLSSTERSLAQHRSSVSKNNSLHVMLTGVYDVGTAHRRWFYSCNDLQTRSHGLANKGAFEPTIRANTRGCEPTLTTNEPTLGLLATFGDVGARGIQGVY